MPHFFERQIVYGSPGLHKAVIESDVMSYQDVVLAEVQEI